MSEKVDFSAEDEEKIINFVKLNEILYNRKKKRFRDTKAKNRLWLKLANELNKDVEVVKNKWYEIREDFVQSKKQQKTDSAASTPASSKRDELLSFLLDTWIFNKSSKDSETESQAGRAGTNSNAGGSRSPVKIEHLRILREALTHRPNPADLVLRSDPISLFLEEMKSNVHKLASTNRTELTVEDLIAQEEEAWTEIIQNLP